MILNETYTLSNSVKIPKLGLGTWMLTDSEAAQAVRDAVAMGYRHIDTAQAYGNEAGVGDGVRTCGISRDELFVTSKVAAENKSYDSAAQSRTRRSENRTRLHRHDDNPQPAAVGGVPRRKTIF